jgi:hypothetical protein
MVPLRDALRSPRVFVGRRRTQSKEWLDNRLEELAEIFALAVGGFSVMDDHSDGLSGSMTQS